MEGRQTTSFICKKWTLFSFCLVGILSTIIMAALGATIVDRYIDDSFGHDPQYDKATLDAAKSLAKALIYVFAVINILFQLVGLIGAYKEHYCMTLTFAILMTLGALGSISNSVKAPAYWWQTVLYFIIAGVAYAYAHDLKVTRDRAFAAAVYVTPVPQTVVHVVPGQSYALPQSYGPPIAGGGWPPQQPLQQPPAYQSK